MASPNTLTLILFVMTMAVVRGLPTRMMWADEADTTTPSFVAKGSILGVRSSEEGSSSEDVPSSEEVPISDDETAEDGRQEGYNYTDSVKSPPKVTLEEWQIKKVLDAREHMTGKDSALIRNEVDMDQLIVNITEEQVAKLLPHYRAYFNRPLEQPTSSSESRARRTTQQRICPADPVITQPQLGINSDDEVVQIVQVNSMNLNQVFFEERCLHETSPISAATCIQVSRFVTALVIDLESLQFDEQTIEIQSCVGVLYI